MGRVTAWHTQPPRLNENSLMKTTLLRYLALAAALGLGALAPRHAAGQTISYTGGTLTENFDNLGPTGTNTPPGWFVGYADPTNLTDLAVNDGSVAPNQTAGWNFGTNDANDRALQTFAKPAVVERRTAARTKPTPSDPVTFPLPLR